MLSMTQSPGARPEHVTTIRRGTAVRLLRDHYDGVSLHRAGSVIVWDQDTPPLADVAIEAELPRGAEGTRERP